MGFLTKLIFIKYFDAISSLQRAVVFNCGSAVLKLLRDQPELVVRGVWGGAQSPPHERIQRNCLCGVQGIHINTLRKRTIDSKQ
jgi:hypothetical protein